MPRSLLIPLTVLLLVSLPAQATETPAKRLHALFAAEYERDLREDPLRATYEGVTRYNDRWPDVSAAAIARRHADDERVLAELERIPRARLSASDQLNYDLFRDQYRLRVASQRFKPWDYDLTAREGLQVLNETTELMPFATVADYELWLRRLDGVGTYLDQYIALLRTAIAEKRTQPRSLMNRVTPQLEQQIVADPVKSPFYTPFEHFPDAIATADRERLAAAARVAIATVVVPGYQRFLDFFRQEYLPASRTSDGIWDTPEGLAFYQNRILYHTTTTLTPEEIHALGLREVARIRGEMDAVIREVGFQGSFQEFLTFLRTDPRFYYATPEELFREYVVIAKQIEPELPKLFGHLYRTPFGVRAIPATSAPTTTTAYYSEPSLDGRRAGYYYVNLYRPEVRPKYEMEVLTAHESVPGHHLQIAIAQEQTGVPDFRRSGDYTAYVEGWALYSERLGYELGLYQDPYSRFGQLTYDMWRAVRLVVDTGIHAKGWTRQQAIDYFTANAAKTATDIENEVDRYIGWPGQALAYKIGQLRLLELRARAEKALGSRFDIREFHDVVLAQGAVPLDVLTHIVDAWIAAKKPLS